MHEKGRIDCGCYVPNVVGWSVEVADALIAELKKTEINLQNILQIPIILCIFAVNI